MGSHWSHWTVQSSLCSGNFEWGRGDISLYSLISWLFGMGSHWSHWKVQSSLCALAVSNGGRGDISLYSLISWLFGMGSHWSHWTVQSSLCALAVSNGGGVIFPYIVLLVDCFAWALIGHIEKCRVHSVLWQFWMGGGGIFPYIFLLVGCFEWALIGHIEQCRDHSVLWQFQMGGGGYFLSLYILISWLFQMGSHWWHWTVKSWLSALAVSNGGAGIIGRLSALVFPYIFLLVDYFEWVLIGNIGQQRVDSVLWQFWMGGGGDNHLFYLGKSENLSSLASQKVFSYYIRKT